MKEQWDKWKRKPLFWVIIVLMILPFVVSPFMPNPEKDAKELAYTEFREMIEKDKVKEVKIDLELPVFYALDSDEKMFKIQNPKTETFKEELLKSDIEVVEYSEKKDNSWKDVLAQSFRSLLSIGLLIFILIYFQNKMMGSRKGEKLYEESEDKITFDEIAGNDEAKEDMQFLVEFLKSPKKYERLGAKLPKGVIFYGPPGTGKTLTAKAIAGEAGVPFFTVSGSDFVEMYVGLGAKRVRELFEEARKKAPAIIFIDEIDAVGGSRDREQHSEQRQTLNAILNEMDGFGSSEGLIVIGATNRLEDLDPAFMRPGRFDKHIAIQLPDQKSRLAIIEVHARDKKFASDIDFEQLAKTTIGFAGAHLEAILNEAAIIATTRYHNEITQEDLDDAYFKMVMKGHRKKDQEGRDRDELKLVAWHEAGHALASKLLTKNEVPKVTIVSSTSGAGGVTFFVPKKMGLYSKEELISDIKVLYAGRAAEELLLGSNDRVTTGAQADIRTATGKLRAMITEYGMSPHYGMLNPQILTQGLQDTVDTSLINEAKEWSVKLYSETIGLIRNNRDLLSAIAEALLERETLTDAELDEIIRKVRGQAA